MTTTNTSTMPANPCADGHQFVWPVPFKTLDYTVPNGLRCLCGKLLFDDLIIEAIDRGLIVDATKRQPRTALLALGDGEPPDSDGDTQAGEVTG